MNTSFLVEFIWLPEKWEEVITTTMENILNKIIIQRPFTINVFFWHKNPSKLTGTPNTYETNGNHSGTPCMK